MNSNRKRKIERIENAFGSDLVCTLKCNSRAYECAVIDYNALGFRLSCRSSEEFAAITQGEIESAHIRYGTYLLGELTFPKVTRALAHENKFVLVPTERSSVELVERPRRADVPYLLEPLLVGPDPVRMREKLILRIENISSRGFRAKCSLSNKHLLPGMRLDGFTITLPSMGTFDCAFKIFNTRVEDGYLVLGGEFLDISKPLNVTIANFVLVCTLDLGAPAKRKPLTRLTTALVRVRRIDPVHEMSRVLELRYAAYSGANKLIANATLDDMTDAHDKNSIILGAFIGSRIVGTIRIVFSREGKAFPFEDHFPFPSHRGLKRETSTEISKMAIDPEYQGTDIVFRLFQAVAIEFLPKCDNALLMSTRVLARNYVALGAERLSGTIPHPVLHDEVLNLYVLNSKKIKAGRMSALAWLFFVREMIDFLARFGFTRKTRTPVLKIMRAPFELMAKKARKVFRGRRVG